MKGNIKARIIKAVDKGLDDFQSWYDSTNVEKDEPFDPTWMDEVKYGRQAN